MINSTQDYIVSYAQNREDILLSGYLQDIDRGFYIDVGANHPVRHSVTNLFYKRGWSGINVEPIEPLHKLLEVARPRDINLNIGIGDKAGSKALRYYVDKDGLSTFSDEMKSSYKATAEDMGDFIDQNTRIQTLQSVLNQYPVKDIHFMKIDVEGFEYEVLKGNDWKKFRPWIICIEANHIIKSWEAILTENKYKLIFNDGLNNYYVAHEHKNIADNFSYPQTVLAKPILQPDIEAAFIKERKDNEGIAYELEHMRAEYEQLSASVNKLEHEIKQTRRLKGSIKQLLKAVDNILAVRIEKLNRPIINKTRISLDVAGVRTSDELLRHLRVYDFDKFYSVRSNHRLSYKIAHSAHRTITRQPIRMFRKVRIKAKDLKRWI